VRVERDESGWAVHLPIRAEEIRLDKRTVRAERVVIRRRGQAQRDMDVTQPLQIVEHHGTLAETGLDTDPLH
jgi:hypothetical protein